jgi:hypothetical protein
VARVEQKVGKMGGRMGSISLYSPVQELPCSRAPYLNKFDLDLIKIINS